MPCVMDNNENGYAIEKKQELENHIHDNGAFCIEGNCVELKISAKLESSNCSTTSEKESEKQSVTNASVVEKRINVSELSPKSCNLEAKFNCTSNKTGLPLTKENNVCLNIYTSTNLSNEIENSVQQNKAVEAEKLYSEPKSKIFPQEKIELSCTSENIHGQTKSEICAARDVITPNILNSKVGNELCYINTESLDYACKLKSDSVSIHSDPLNAVSTISADPNVQHERLVVIDNCSLETSNEKNVHLIVHEDSSEKLNFTFETENNIVKGSKFETNVLQDVLPVASSSDPKICLNLESACVTRSKVHEKTKNTTTYTMNTLISKTNGDGNLNSKTNNMYGIQLEQSLNTVCSADTIPSQTCADKNSCIIRSESKKSLSVTTPATESLISKTNDKYLNPETDNMLEIQVEKSFNTISSVSEISSQTCPDKITNKIKNQVLEKSLNVTTPAIDKLTSETKDNNCLNSKNNMLGNKIDESFNSMSSVDAVPLEKSADNCSNIPCNSVANNDAEKSLSKIMPIVAATSNCNDLSGIKTETQKNVVANSAAISQNEMQSTDLYALEKSDIEDPEWETVKKLTSNEERYKQVRECWKSQIVPNPNKNLTYHSYRKKKLKAGKLDVRVIKQHKRQASESAECPRKRARECTYTVDNKINSIRSERISKTKLLRNEMNQHINNLNFDFKFNQDKLREYYDCYGYNNCYQDLNRNYTQEWNSLKKQYDQDLHDITYEYRNKIDSCTSQCQSAIDKLNKVHDEILQFCNFYKGLQEDNPTVLTDAQLQEIEEIDNVYEQFKKIYV